jgi:hypothetical protein
LNSEAASRTSSNAKVETMIVIASGVTFARLADSHAMALSGACCTQLFNNADTSGSLNSG